ncbi:hypothetical protein GCM10011575_09520 [Microlunatus endophyticus]|uniref:Uncharacterized protein n=1 Tax=Microlunatus endophyticus TaxID=1716077 RepID=A0A917S4S2_9ACTN|nr:hypothetical protein GCM10011575_09520 [Microlunatus endophyticus]
MVISRWNTLPVSIVDPVSATAAGSAVAILSVVMIVNGRRGVGLAVGEGFGSPACPVQPVINASTMASATPTPAQERLRENRFRLLRWSSERIGAAAVDLWGVNAIMGSPPSGARHQLGQ